MKRHILCLMIITYLTTMPAWAEEADSSRRLQVAGSEKEAEPGRMTQVADKTEAEPVQMPLTPASRPGPDYIIGPGDVVDISLWRDDALSKQVTVLPDGKISFPLVGQVAAEGRTVADLKHEITERLVPFVPEPVLNIEVKQVNSMILYVIGRVNSPGRFVLNTNVNVLQALSIAGGLNPFAKRSKIKIFRKQGDQTKAFPFNYDEVVDGEKLSQNIALQRGDVIVVP